MKTYDFIYRIIYQAAAVICISAVIGLGINYIRPDGIPIIGDWSVQAQLTLSSGKNIEISVQEARKLCLEGEAILVDARSPEEYQAGHIECSINLPWLSFDDHFQTLSKLPSDKMIITYCDGQTCHLSKDLAVALTELGFTNVRVLVNGWTVWVQNQFPTKQGEEKRLES